MAGLKSSMVAFMLIMVASMQMQSSMAQTRHVVGDALGWTIPSNGAAAYTTWASQQTFRVGDTLVFNFTTGVHNVAEVTQAAYGPCTTASPISITTNGPASIPLTTAGAHYYVCTVGTHCQIGQKLAINVSGPAVAPTTPPASPPTTTPPPATSPTTTPSPTPAPVSPPTTTPTPAPGPSTTTPPTSSEAPTPAGATPPAPETTGPSPASDTNPPPPPSPSAAGSLTVAPAALLAFALALFY